MSTNPGSAITRTAYLFAATIAAAALLVVAVAAPAANGSGGIGTAEAGGQTGGGATSPKYVRLWERVSKRDKRWAKRTSECESGGDPKAIGGGGIYRGAFQFLKSTWRTSPKSPGGDPIRFTYKTQAVVAVHLKKRAGTSPWPVCG